MYKLIKAKPEHAEQILPYLSITCYWKEFAEGNLLGQEYEAFMLEWVIQPRLPFTTVLVKGDEEDKIYGCIITAMTRDLALMPDYSPHLHPRVLEVFKPYFEFPTRDGVVVELYAINKDLQGKGYGAALFRVAEELATAEHAHCISGFIWSFFPNSLVTAIRNGCRVAGCITFPELTELPLLYVQKTTDFIAMTDYFQSDAYKEEINLLFK